MAAKLGYGGVSNTNGARDFTGKTPAAGADYQPLILAGLLRNVLINAGLIR